MACPTCDHTMHIVAVDVAWCPRCGTLRTTGDDCIPMLIPRLVEFSGTITDKEQWVIDEFERLGIRESITGD